MSTLVSKPFKGKMLNARLLAIAAALLLVLALFFLASPLLRTTSGSQGSSNFPRQFDGQTLPGGGNGFSNQGGTPQGIPGQSDSNVPARLRGGGGLVSFDLLSGTGGTIVYAIALLISLAAAAGMFMVKRWGKTLGIIMAVLYGLLALVSLLPLLFISFMGASNALMISLGVLKLLLAILIIVLASIPGKKVVPPDPAGSEISPASTA